LRKRRKRRSGYSSILFIASTVTPTICKPLLPLDKYEIVLRFTFMGINPIRDIVKEACRRKGISLNRLALGLSINPVYLSNVIHGRKTSRPLIRKIAEVLGLPSLPQIYEEYLKNPKNPIKEVKSNDDARNE
jgi:hypothetical protein